MMNNQSLPAFADSGSFRTFLKTHDAGFTRLHHHPSYEMNFVLEGEGTRIVGDQKDYFEEGDLILLAPGIPHNWVNKQSSSSAYSSLVIQWDENFLGKTWQQAPEFSEIGKLFKLSSRAVLFDKESGKEIRSRKSDLLTLPPFERLMLLLRILHEFSASEGYTCLSDDGLVAKRNIPNSRLEKVHAFVKENYSEKITLKLISETVNMSEGAFSRFFSQNFKKPFFSYLNEYRINQSYRLLEETDLRINEIGYACGYDCLQFFYRQFMKYTQCAPQDYRKKFLERLGQP